MRSNDLWFGFCNDQYCFSQLQQLVADETDYEIGTYFHFAHNLHLYERDLGKFLKPTNIAHNVKQIIMDNLTYYLYHIPGKKIGVTRNLNSRVTQQQGYSPDEYEVLDQSTDIDYISSREIELQKSYGYRVDHKPYKQLFKMKINATEQTSNISSSIKQT